MKKLSKNPIDQYFRENLESPDLEYNKQDWKGLEEMLPKNQKKKSLVWWLPASVAAAVVILFISLWLNKPITNTGEVVRTKDKVSESDKISAADDKTANTSDALSKSKSSSTTLNAPTYSNPNLHQNVSSIELSGFPEPNSGNAVKASETTSNEAVIPAVPITGFMNLQPQAHLFAGNISISNKYNVIMPPSSDEEVSTKNLHEKSGSKFSLGLSFSPDINSINKFSESSFGNSAGLAVSYQISPRLSVNTGVAYSRKLYSAEPYEYKAPWAYSNAGRNAELIDADCRVLDVPLNLSYSIFKSAKKTVFASAGVSSYFMLKEKYTLIAGSSPSGYPSYPNPSYNYKNENQHLLSVLNVSAGISKPIGKQTSLVVEPYMRLPVTGIGQGKVHLKSIGLNLQFKYNFKKSGLNKTNPAGDAQ